MERVVNIIGMGSGAASMPDTGENWGINFAHVFGKMDKLFFMDGLEVILSQDKRIKDTYGICLMDSLIKYPSMQLISKNPIQEVIFNEDGSPIMRGEPEKCVMIDPFPINEALKLIPGAYFTSTIAYVLAYAILEKVDRIRLYGFEIWSGSEANEYAYQRPCVDFWIAFAMGRGIKVEVPWYFTQSCANSQNLYGYSKNELNGRLK